jgi:small basic protein
MIDLAQFGTVAGLAILVGVIIQVFKASVPADKVPYLAILVGIVLSLGIAEVRNELLTSESVVSYLIGGFFAALTAIGGYEATLNRWQAPTNPPTPPTPPTA